MARRAGDRDAGGRAAAEVESDRVGAAVGGNRGTDRPGDGRQRVDREAIGPRRCRDGGARVGSRHCEVEIAADSGGAAESAGRTQAQASGQAAAGDGVGIGRETAAGADGLAISGAYRTVGQRERADADGWRRHGNAHSGRGGRAAGVGGGVGKAVRAGIPCRRGIGDAGTAGRGGAMARRAGDGNAGSRAAAEVESDRVGAAVGGNRGTDRPGGGRRYLDCPGIGAGTRCTVGVGGGYGEGIQAACARDAAEGAGRWVQAYAGGEAAVGNAIGIGRGAAARTEGCRVDGVCRGIA